TQGCRKATTLGSKPKTEINAESVRPVHRQPFQGLNQISNSYPGLSLRSNPGLKLANAFGVNSKPKLANAFGVNSKLKLANAFGVNSKLKLANAFGVNSKPKLANAFGVNSKLKLANAFGVSLSPLPCTQRSALASGEARVRREPRFTHGGPRVRRTLLVCIAHYRRRKLWRLQQADGTRSHRLVIVSRNQQTRSPMCDNATNATRTRRHKRHARKKRLEYRTRHVVDVRTVQKNM